MRFLIIGAGSMGKRRARCIKALGYNDINMYDINYPENTSIDGVFFVSQNWKPETVFELGKYDAVIVSTPPLTKQIYIDLASKYNTPCFTEADVILYHGYYYPSASMRFHPAIQKIKEIVDNGMLGKIYTFTHHCGNHIEDWHPGCDKKTYYAMKKETGGCKEIFPFELSWLSYLFGSPIDCTGFIDKKLNDQDISADDVYAVCVKFQTCIGSILVDVLSRPAVRELSVIGSKGTLKWNWNDSFISIETAEGLKITHGYDKGQAAEGYNANICEEMYQNELANWIAAIQGKEQYLFSREDEMAVMDMLRKVEGQYAI
jgi:hypothetical protein